MSTYYRVTNYGSPMTSWNVYHLYQVTAAGKDRCQNKFHGASFEALKAESDRLRARGATVVWNCRSAARSPSESAAFCHCTNCGNFHLAGDTCPKVLGLVC